MLGHKSTRRSEKFYNEPVYYGGNGYNPTNLAVKHQLQEVFDLFQPLVAEELEHYKD